METAPPLKLHAIRGREIGLMIIGTPEALANLGQQLQAALSFGVTSEVRGWPPQVALLVAESPYRDRPDYEVSFHVQVEPLSASLQKRSRYGPNMAFVLAVTVLTLVGAFSLLRLLWNAL